MGILKIGAIVGAVIGLVLVLLASILGWVVLPKFVDDKIKEEVRLIEGSETWDKWADIDLPIEFKFYIFNVTNPDDIEKGFAPILQEKGPYVYSEKRWKENLTVDGDIISYIQPILYEYNETLSGPDLSEDDLVNIINIPYLSVLHVVRELGFPPITNILNTILRLLGERVIRKNVRVGDLTFEGMPVDAYRFLGNLLPEEFSGWRFGLYKGNNGSDDGLYEIHSGVEDHKLFGEIASWNGQQVMNVWENNSYCDMINGTDGSIFPPFVDKNRILRVFVVDLCRSLYLTYKEKSEIMGIKSYRFSVPKEALDDPRVNADNACFCHHENVNDCPYGGALPVAECRGAPIVMSAPYFLDGDYRYNLDVFMQTGDEITRMTPNRELHETIMDLEPNSGVLLNANKRLQVNMHLENNPIEGFRFVKNMYFPLVWIDESAGVDEKSAEELKDKLLKPMKIIDIAKWTVLGVGIVITIVGGILFWKA